MFRVAVRDREASQVAYKILLIGTYTTFHSTPYVTAVLNIRVFRFPSYTDYCSSFQLTALIIRLRSTCKGCNGFEKLQPVEDRHTATHVYLVFRGEV